MAIKSAFYLILFILIFLPIIYLFLSMSQTVILRDLTELIFSIFSFDKRISNIFFSTIFIGIITTIISTFIGLSLTILFECTNLFSKRLFYFILFIPFLIPPSITAFSWLILLAEKLNLAAFFNIYNEFVVGLFLSFSYYPIVMLITSLGLRNLDSVYIEASILSNKKRTIQKIILPLIKPHLIISCLFVFFLAISEYTTPAFLRVNTYTNEIFTQFAAFYNLYGAVIYSIPMVILALVFVSAIYIYLRNKSFVTISSFTKRWKNFIELSKNWKILSYLYILAILSVSLLIPFAILLYTSKLQFLSAISLAKNSILDSILITTISSLLLTFLGFLTAYFFKNNKSLILLISFPLALSSSVIGISLINLYSNLPLPIYGTIVILIMGYLMKFMPFAVFIFSSFLSQISVSLEEAGRIFTSSQLKIIRKIFIPLSKNGFVSAFIILFIFIFSEIGITQLLSPPAFQTLTFRIDTLMHYGDYKNVASLSLILSTFVILFSLLYAVVFRNYDKS